MGQQQQPRHSDPGSVQVEGLIHGRSYKLVPFQGMPRQRRERVASWLDAAAAAAHSPTQKRVAAGAAMVRPRRKPSMSREPEQARAADREQPRRAAAERARRHERFPAVHAPPHAVRGRGSVIGRQWRSKSSSPVSGPGMRRDNQTRRRSAGPQSSSRIRTMQRQAISVEELRRSYGAWQRATQRLIDLGHTATKRRLWNTCRRAFKVRKLYLLWLGKLWDPALEQGANACRSAAW